jgi:DNA phosphorothioation-dependent restriction protein DptG
MEISKEELIQKRKEGKLKILNKSYEILEELYEEKIKQENELLVKLDKDMDKYFENWKKIEEIREERSKILQEMQRIDEQL